MLKLLYTKNTIIERLRRYFLSFFSGLPVPTKENLFLFVLSIIALESADSVRFLYRHFINRISEKSLNAFYYMCSHSKFDYSTLMKFTASMALRMVPKDLEPSPLFLCIDDTMVEKFGVKFEYVSKLFDHAAHNGSSYLNGHCFVSIMLCVPVWQGKTIVYKGIPLAYRMWKKDDASKLDLAASMIREVMDTLADLRKIVVLGDCWYGKSCIFRLSEEFENLDVICNVRHDTVLYDLAPPRTGKAGRPAKKGRKLSINDDFMLSDEKKGGFHVGMRKVMTNLVSSSVTAFVTAPQKDGIRRLFLSTVDTNTFSMPCAWQQNAPLNQCGSEWKEFIPLFWYDFRWNIETSYYEHKTFWSLCHYMIRSAVGIESVVNLICVAYSAMIILPYTDEVFSTYRQNSPQEFRFVLSQKIQEQIYLTGFMHSAENGKKPDSFKSALRKLVFSRLQVA